MAERTYTLEQIKVIEHGEGHAAVSAVAGSGKTRRKPNEGSRKTLGYETPAERCRKAVASIS